MSAPMLHLLHRTSRLAIKLAVLAMASAMVLLHGWVFWRRLSEGLLLDAEVAMRWLGALALGLAAGWLQRQGVSLSRGRSAWIFWLAVLVLHVGISAPLTDAGALGASVPPGMLALCFLPAALGWLSSLGHRHRAMSPRSAGPMSRQLAMAPCLAVHYAPTWRRPPPF